MQAGERAPAFRVPDQEGHIRSLSEFRGHVLVLYFYPRASTSG